MWNIGRSIVWETALIHVEQLKVHGCHLQLLMDTLISAFLLECTFLSNAQAFVYLRPLRWTQPSSFEAPAEHAESMLPIFTERQLTARAEASPEI